MRCRLLGLEISVVGHKVKCLPHEECPQVLIKVRHLRTHPLAEGDMGSGTLLHSGLQPVLHASVLSEPVSQLQNGLVNLPPSPTGYWPGGASCHVVVVDWGRPGKSWAADWVPGWR